MNNLRNVRKRLLLPLLVAAPLLLLAGRLAWVASRTETGWGVLALHWRDATLGWFTGRDTPVQNRRPADQAEFWLAEVERILDENPPSAELAMGAAWVLDSPGTGFLHEHLRSPNPVGAPPATREIVAGFTRPQLDFDAVRQAQEQFETRCRVRCLDLAERATQLESNDVRWWRMRALLAFWCAPFNIELHTRDTNWSELLQDAGRHDPDNALYDYLAALEYWNASAIYDLKESAGGYELTITDADGFARGDEHFAQAQQKAVLVTGGAGLIAAAELLSRSVLPPHDQSDIAISRLVDYRGDVLLARLHRWSVVRADVRRQRGDVEGAADLWRQMLRLLEQIETADRYSALESKVPTYRRIAPAFALRLAEDHPGVISAEEVRDLKSVREAARLRQKAMEAAAERLKLRERGTPIPLVSAITMAASLPPAVVLFVAGALGLILAACITGRQPRPNLSFGPFRHAFAWSAAFALTVLLSAVLPPQGFGRVSAETIQRSLDLRGIWGKVLLNWITWPAPYFATAVALATVAGWYAVRFARATHTELTQFLVSGPRAKWGAWVGCISRSAVGLAICLVAVHLATAPPVLRTFEDSYRFEMSCARDPDGYWSNLREAIAAVEADAELMRQLRAELAREEAASH